MISGIISALTGFYSLLIFIYVLLTWFPQNGVIGEIERVLGTICEPFLGIFRKIIPPIGGKSTGIGIDISPVIAILVLELVSSLIVRIL